MVDDRRACRSGAGALFAVAGCSSDNAGNNDNGGDNANPATENNDNGGNNGDNADNNGNDNNNNNNGNQMGDGSSIGEGTVLKVPNGWVAIPRATCSCCWTRMPRPVPVDGRG
ncbi:MAG: hypothetical protein ACLSVD_11100 [Eggerthellaceae bacterium]